jgi:hypothetical protein
MSGFVSRGFVSRGFVSRFARPSLSAALFGPSKARRRTVSTKKKRGSSEARRRTPRGSSEARRRTPRGSSEARRRTLWVRTGASLGSAFVLASLGPTKCERSEHGSRPVLEAVSWLRVSLRWTLGPLRVRTLSTPYVFRTGILVVLTTDSFVRTLHGITVAMLAVLS